jgi:hypothetical protein
MEIVFIIIGTLASVTLLSGYNLYLRSKERHKLIDKGLDPSLVNIYQKDRTYSNVFLYVGILLLGTAMGISSGVILGRSLQLPGETKELIVLSLIVWTGVSCIICYYLSRFKDK